MCPPRKIFASVSLRKSTSFTISEAEPDSEASSNPVPQNMNWQPDSECRCGGRTTQTA